MFCTRLDQTAGIERIGGKASNLAWAAALGCRVPDTIVVTREALSRFIDHNRLEVTLTEYHRIARTPGTLEGAFEQLAVAVRTCSLPDDLRAELTRAIAEILDAAPSGIAVRSSAIYEDSDTASFAGIFASTIGASDIEQTIDAIIACWLSAWTPRALRYLDRMGIEPVIDAMAVMLQPVLQATSAGVIVTANPDTGNPWEFVLHATRGLALDLMSGSGVGDRYLLDWESGVVREQHPAAATALLSTSRCTEIAAAARRLDEAATKRMDVEWVLADGLWIVQVRPLTALPPFRSPEVQRLDASASWQLPFFALPLRGDLPQGFLTPLYADLSESELWHRYQPSDIILTGIWKHEADLHGYRYVDTGPRPTFFDYLSSVDDFETWLDHNEAQYRDRWNKRHDELAAIEEIARSALRDTTSAAALIPATIAVRDRIWDLNSFGWSGPQALGWMCEAMLGRFLHAIDPSLRLSSLIGGEASYTFTLAAALQDLGRSIQDDRVRAAFRDERLGDVLRALQERAPDCDFLHDYESLCRRFGKTPPSWGRRPAFWRTPWEDGDAAAIHAIRSALRGEARDVREAQRESRHRRDGEESRVRTLLTTKKPEDLARFDHMLDRTRYWTQALNDRHGVVVGLLWERELIWHLGLRLTAERLTRDPADILLMRTTDLLAYARDGAAAAFTQTLAARTREYHRNRRFTAPTNIGPTVEPLPAEDHPPQSPETNPKSSAELTGVGFGSGRATGHARIVRTLTPELIEAITPTDILVVLDANAFAYTDWHSLLMLVQGVVAAARPAHHLTQVAREIGVPVIGHLGPAITRIQDGAFLHLDAAHGTIRIE